MLIAMWKYYEYNVETGQAAAGGEWLVVAWHSARRAADFLTRMYDDRYRLVRSNSDVVPDVDQRFFLRGGGPDVRPEMGGEHRAGRDLRIWAVRHEHRRVASST